MYDFGDRSSHFLGCEGARVSSVFSAGLSAKLVFLASFSGTFFFFFFFFFLALFCCTPEALQASDMEIPLETEQ